MSSPRWTHSPAVAGRPFCPPSPDCTVHTGGAGRSPGVLRPPPPKTELNGINAPRSVQRTRHILQGNVLTNLCPQRCLGFPDSRSLLHPLFHLSHPNPSSQARRSAVQTGPRQAQGLVRTTGCSPSRSLKACPASRSLSLIDIYWRRLVIA